ncbi:MAG TPA: DUF2125 domain-containing protein [Rhizomicrobium sp.]|jgi:hypothetical protein|nr:DUF2125 domain-containing protein [Rhizomicrobium sp.]
MRYSSRFFLYAPFAALLILAALAMIHWWIVAATLSKRLDAANGHEIMPGVVLRFSDRKIGGFPFRLDTVLKNVRLSVNDVAGPVSWSSEDFAMHALTYGRDQAILEAAGKQTLSWRDAMGKEHRFDFLPGSFRASASLHDGRLERFDSEIRDLDGDDFRSGNAQLHFRSHGGGIDVYLKFDDAHIASGYAAALGPAVESLTASASLDHSLILTKLLQGKDAPENALEEWRQNGGKITVSDLALKRNVQDARFSGALSLDSAHDLSGTLSGNSAGSSLRFTGNRIGISGSPRP